MSRRAAKGTLFKRGDGASPEVFTTVAQVANIGGPSLSADAIDVSDHDGAWKAFVAGLKDGGEIKLELNWDPALAGHANSSGLLSDLGGAEKNYQILWPGTVTWTLPAILTGFEPAAPVDGKLAASVTLKVTGTPTLA